MTSLLDFGELRGMKRSSRTRSFLVSNPRWLAYVTAGAATAIAGARYAEAEIHYSGQSIRLRGDVAVDLPLSNGASLVFQLIGRGTTYQQEATFKIQGAISGSARAYGSLTQGGRNLLSKLYPNDVVSNGPFSSVGGSPGFGVLFSSDAGQFFPDGGIVGFRFDTGRGTQYGWARVRTDRVFRTHEHYHMIVEDYAWADPGESIQAGQKHSAPQQADALSKKGSLGLLAAGARGLTVWRAARAQTNGHPNPPIPFR
ncbi:MAG: hypothetical protein ACREIF_12485 [Chthoniobacterales bacterium]